MWPVSYGVPVYHQTYTGTELYCPITEVQVRRQPYSTMKWVKTKPGNCWKRVQCSNHCTTKPHIKVEQQLVHITDHLTETVYHSRRW